MKDSSKQLISFPAIERHQRINYYTINPNVATSIQQIQIHQCAAINFRSILYTQLRVLRQ